MKPQSEVKCSRVANVKTSKCKVVKSLKPLVNFRFYLDIEGHNISQKVESKIKELGGSIEFLLTKEVTHFITDKVIDNREILVQSPQGPASPQTSISNYSELGSNASNGNESKGGGKVRSRADAMLQRARKVTTESERQITINRSPSQVARRWGTPIWHTEYALKYFEKVYNAIKEHYKGEFPPKTKEKPGNAKVLKGNFIKIESFQKQYRPYYHLLKGKWPAINLKCDENIGAFIYANEQSSKSNTTVKAVPRKLPESKKSQDSTMTRKNRSTKHIRVQPSSRLSSDKQCGFCEICRVEYDVLTAHLKTDEHINFVKNDRNFLELDSLIKSSANVKFLSINKTIFNGNSECEIFPKRSRRSAAVNNRLIRNHSHSEVDIIKNSLDISRKSLSEGSFSRNTRKSFSRQSINLPPPTLPRCDEGEKKPQVMSAMVRARRESVKKINYAEPGEDEEISDDAAFSAIQRKRAKNPKTPGIKANIEESPDVKPKRPPSTVMYKVVEPKSNNIVDKKENLTEKNFEQPAPLIVKFRKVRQTELSILNGEAVNFMFPPKMSSDVPTDVDRHTTSEVRTTQSNEFTSSPKRKSSVISQCTDESQDSNTLKRKKVNNSPLIEPTPATEPTPAIEPTPATEPVESNQNTQEVVNGERKVRRYRKRRFRRAPIQPSGQRRIKLESVSLNETEAINMDSSPPEDGMGENNETRYNLNNLLKNELGQYKFSFERVPYSEPWYDVFQRQDEYKELVFEYYGSTVYRKLPYEMGPLPPLPAMCDCRKTKSEGDKPNVSTSSTPIEKLKSTSKGGNQSTTENIQTDSTSSNSKMQSAIDTNKNTVNRVAALLNVDMPRKSPREHPSTLAILSCLINRREEKASAKKLAKQTLTEEAKKAEDTQSENQKFEKPVEVPKPIENGIDLPLVIKAATPVLPTEEIIVSEPTKEPPKIEISPQIGENVKRLRRGQKLLESKMIKSEAPLDGLLKRKRGRPPKNPLDFVPSRPRKQPQEKPKTYFASQQNYVDVNQLKKQIDLYLSQPPTDVDLRENESIPIPIPVKNKNRVIDNFRHELDLGKLVFAGASSDAMNIFNMNTTKSITNKMRFYKLFSTNKKIKVNRTGWPKKRRVITRHQNSVKITNLYGLSSIDLSNQVENEITNEITIPAPSPITPPETDVEEKPECEPSLPTAIPDENTNLTFTSERADNSDMFTVSSDSLDTVLDVGSQIKTEVQKEIIASRKCKVNLSNKLPLDVKIRKSSRICFRRNKHLYLHRRIDKVKPERTDTGDESEPASNSSCSPHPSTPTDNRMKVSLPAKSSPTPVCPLSPRRLRKPRGRWYRER